MLTGLPISPKYDFFISVYALVDESLMLITLISYFPDFFLMYDARNICIKAGNGLIVGDTGLIGLAKESLL